jgi:tetratricopeptide (TPR) repeat protein
MMVGNNLLQVLSSNPISNQDVIDAAGEFVRVRPDSKKASDVYKVLGDAYDSRGRYNKALHYYKLSGKFPADEIKELEEDAAKKLVEAAGRTRSKTDERRMYTAVLQLYPETKAAEEAKGKLARLVRLEHHGLRLSKRFLTEHPELYGPRGLGLRATLFDDNADNMELADKGLNIVDRGTILLHYDTPWGIQQRKYPVNSSKIARFETVLREKHYDLAALDVDRRDKNSPGGFKNLPERLKKLELRRDDVDLRFFRDAQAATGSYPTVLGHELLSEKETDPQKGYNLPNVRGSITTSGISLSGDIPASFLGNELVVGNDVNSPYAGLRIPIPFLEGFVPVDFMIRARPGGPSLTPRLRTGDDAVEDAHLYR